MKKLLLIFALAAAGLQGWADELYLVGNALSIGWNINNALRATAMKETSTGTNIYEWTGYIKGGDTSFKILSRSGEWDYGYRPTENRVTLSSTESVVWYRNGSGDADNQWQVSSDGVYKITFDKGNSKIKAEAASLTVPTLTEGYYQIGTANDLVNFANAINKGLIGPNVKAKLTADIDMASITDFTPICCANAIKFTGEFDGQGHAITNLAVDYGTSFGYTGLFCYATDGAVIKNLIVGTGCSFKGTAKIGGIIGSAEGGGTVTLTNVINMAYVQANGNSDANAAGLVGCGSGNTVIVATNCANTGEIHGQDGECAAFAGWTQSGTSFTNCWNIGDIYNMDNNQSLYRKPGDATITLSNCYDANGADFYTQGTKIARTTVESGELCYKLNGDQTSINWYQNLGTDNNPVPFSSSETVLAGQWFNSSEIDVYYNKDASDHITVYKIDLNEDKTAYNVPANVTTKHISFTRHYIADKWIGICTPISFYCPSDWEARELTSVSGNGENATMIFSEADIIWAGKPYLVKPSRTEDTILSLGETTVLSATQYESNKTVSINGINMIGNLCQTTLTTGDFYINKSSELKKLTAASATLKGFRAYFTVDDPSNVKALSFDFEDDATGIENLNVNDNLNEGAIYNLAGQRLNKAQKGINIINGKKILK